MLRTLGELLFLENSRPLHRQLLGLLRPLPAPHSVLLGRFVCERVAQQAQQHLPEGWPGEGAPQVERENAQGRGAAAARGQPPATQQEEGASASDGQGAAGAAQRDGSPDGGAGAGASRPSSVPLGQALTSLLGFPSMRPFLGPSAAPAVACVSLNIKAVLSGAAGGAAGAAGAGTAGGGGTGPGEGAAVLHIPPAVMEDVQDAGATRSLLSLGDRCV